ncbi:hypothetical protein [Moorena sp. SIO1G6]|nr:hypothetical protein [Moorena sp. SIO1G6]
MANLITGQTHHYGLGGSPHSRFAVVSPTRALHQDRVIILT